jgi:hypothetical protein
VADTIKVSPGPKAMPPKGKAGKVILSEVDEQHPHGQAFVYAPHEGEDPKVFEVGRTGTVQQLLGRELLVENSKGDLDKSQEPVTYTNAPMLSGAATPVATEDESSTRRRNPDKD